MGFAGIPFPTESTLLLCHFLHFRLIKRILLYFKFFIAETAPGFPFPLYPTTSTSLSCFFSFASSVDETERRRRRSRRCRATSPSPASPSCCPVLSSRRFPALPPIHPISRIFAGDGGGDAFSPASSHLAFLPPHPLLLPLPAPHPPP